MFTFLIPLLSGFCLNAASAFTTAYSRWLGMRGGRLVCMLLRDVLGIPAWVIGYAMAIRTPSVKLSNPPLAISIFAWLILLSGAAIILCGLITIRWRAAAPSMQDTLVTHGIYAYIRHPLYSGLLLELAGLFLWIPTVAVFIACLLGGLWILVQARLEEIDLVQRIPAYQEYMQRVPRFVPKPWKR